MLNQQALCQELKLWCIDDTWFNLMHLCGRNSIMSPGQTSFSKPQITESNETAECTCTLDNMGNYQMTQKCHSRQPLHLSNPPLLAETDQMIYYLRSYAGSGPPSFYIN